MARVLDELHDAAAKADEDRYFGLFAPEGVFFGTDPAERWTVAQFREWAAPYFKRESAWTYVLRDRHVEIAPGGEAAWFDEVVENRSYGACRGTGVMRKVEGDWKIAQYNLSIPVPNFLAEDLVARIRAASPSDQAAAAGRSAAAGGGTSSSGGAAAIEKAAKDAGVDVKVPFTPGRADASQEQTDVESFAPLEPRAEGFRNYINSKKMQFMQPEEALVDKAQLLRLTGPEMTALVGGLRVLGANVGGSKDGVFTTKVGTLTI